jgi:hypothetical protein
MQMEMSPMSVCNAAKRGNLLDRGKKSLYRITDLLLPPSGIAPENGKKKEDGFSECAPGNEPMDGRGAGPHEIF